MHARLREITRDYKPLTSATKTTAMIPGLVNGRPSKIGEQRWDLECFHHRTRYGRADVCGPTLLSPHGSSRHASSRHALITRYDCFPTVMSQRMPLRRHISVSRNGLSCRLLPPKLVYRPAFLHRPHTLRKNGAASAGPIEALSLSPYACPGDRVGVNGAVWGRSDWLTTWMMCYAIPTMMEKTRSQRLADKAKAEQLRCCDWLLTFMQNNHAKLWTKAELREVAILTAVARPSLGSLAALAFDSFRRKSSHRLPSRLTSRAALPGWVTASASVMPELSARSNRVRCSPSARRPPPTPSPAMCPELILLVGWADDLVDGVGGHGKALRAPPSLFSLLFGRCRVIVRVKFSSSSALFLDAF